jgi:hypothetical protein
MIHSFVSLLMKNRRKMQENEGERDEMRTLTYGERDELRS